jgi:hypothetical protein
MRAKGHAVVREETMPVTYQNVVAAVSSGHRRKFQTSEEVDAVVAAVNRGDVAIVQLQKHRVTVVYSGVICGIEKPKKPQLIVQPAAA